MRNAELEIRTGEGKCLDATFLDVVDVEPVVDDFVCGDELLDVSFDEDLELFRHFADAFVTEAVVPDDDFLGPSPAWSFL